MEPIFNWSVVDIQCYMVSGVLTVIRQFYTLQNVHHHLSLYKVTAVDHIPYAVLFGNLTGYLWNPISKMKNSIL